MLNNAVVEDLDPASSQVKTIFGFFIFSSSVLDSCPQCSYLRRVEERSISLFFHKLAKFIVSFSRNNVTLLILNEWLDESYMHKPWFRPCVYMRCSSCSRMLNPKGHPAKTVRMRRWLCERCDKNYANLPRRRWRSKWSRRKVLHSSVPNWTQLVFLLALVSWSINISVFRDNLIQLNHFDARNAYPKFW